MIQKININNIVFGRRQSNRKLGFMSCTRNPRSLLREFQKNNKKFWEELIAYFSFTTNNTQRERVYRAIASNSRLFCLHYSDFQASHHIAPTLRLLVLNNLPEYRHFFFPSGRACDVYDRRSEWHRSLFGAARLEQAFKRC
jgi:hypothetical protein